MLLKPASALNVLFSNEMVTAKFAPLKFTLALNWQCSSQTSEGICAFSRSTRLVNGCANDSHTMSMQLDTGQRARQ